MYLQHHFTTIDLYVYRDSKMSRPHTHMHTPTRTNTHIHTSDLEEIRLSLYATKRIKSRRQYVPSHLSITESNFFLVFSLLSHLKKRIYNTKFHSIIVKGKIGLYIQTNLNKELTQTSLEIPKSLSRLVSETFVVWEPYKVTWYSCYFIRLSVKH